LRFLIRRMSFYVITAWAALTLNFLIPRLMPGDPAGVLLTRFQGRLGPDAEKALVAMFGSGHHSLWSDYLTYTRDLLHANLGTSFAYFPMPVSSVIGQSLPWTAVLVGVATVISFFLGTLLGIVVAWRRGSWLDNLVPVTTFLAGIPYFWVALILLYVLGAKLNWFPLYGGYSQSTTIGFSGSFLSSAAYHALLPATTIVVSSIAGWLLAMRNMMVSVLDEDYVVLAQAKGLTNRRIMFSYAARNAVLPSVAGFALALGFVVSGAILVETVFTYPGMGYVLYQAVIAKDYPLMQGVFLVISLAILIANLAADVCYVLLDPRTRVEG
jgi:peptide/nickel transport system permease protein